MAAKNPNPARISDALWNFWIWFDQLEAVQLGGIFAAKGGYHDIRSGHSGDYSVAEVPEDREGPADKASAIDLSMAPAQMRLHTARLDAATKRRDERLYIGGRPILREFIGTKNGSAVYCYVLTGGRARGLPADAAEDWSRDESHLWHLHISIIRKWCASADAMDRLFSVMGNEPLTAWRARRAPAPTPVQEDDMPIMNIPVPAGFAYKADEDWAPGNESAVTIALPPAGHKDANSAWNTKRLFLSLAGDHAAAGTGPTVRVAIHNGGGWTVATKVVTSGARVQVDVPVAASTLAYNVTVGRVATDVAEHANLPVSVLVEIV